MLSRICIALHRSQRNGQCERRNHRGAQRSRHHACAGRRACSSSTPSSSKTAGSSRSASMTDLAQADPDATDIDGGGKYVLPGLTDAHGHVLGLGELKLQADLRDTSSIDDALGRIRKHIAANPNARWVIGRGWNQVLWKERRFPTARELDAIVADRPAIMSRVDGHASWVNTAALKVAGITATTPDPQGGQIVRDASGQPTGMLIDIAEELVEKHIPTATDAEDEEPAARCDERGRVARHDRRPRCGHRWPHLRSVSRAGRCGAPADSHLRDAARQPRRSRTHAIRSAHARIRRSLADARRQSVGRRRSRQSWRGDDAGLQRSAASPRSDDVHARADAGAGDADSLEGLATERPRDRRCRQPPGARHARDHADEGTASCVAAQDRACAGDCARRHPPVCAPRSDRVHSADARDVRHEHG